MYMGIKNCLSEVNKGNGRLALREDAKKRVTVKEVKLKKEKKNKNFPFMPFKL